MRFLRRAAARPGLAVAAVGLIAFAGAALLTAVRGAPVPAVHDEFSYLLAADTFLHGRCANPPHPLWEHFEAPHTLQQPAYASKYPPGQGLALAAGRLLGGHPVVGAWLGTALACAAVCWMLQAWLPPRWALVGGLLAVTRLVFEGEAVRGAGTGYWSQTYWGGSVAALGGALLLGGWRRVVRSPHWFPAAVMGVGLVVLANSRPFEGLVLAVPVGVATLVWLARPGRPAWGVLARQVVLPLAAVLLPAAAATAYYNARVTGSPFRLPYQAYADQYGITPVFLPQPLRPAGEYRHEVLRDFYTRTEPEPYLKQQSFAGWRQGALEKFLMWWGEYLGPILTPPLVLLGFALRNRSLWTPLVAGLAVLGVVVLLETWGFPHYSAPLAGVVFLLVAQALRHVHAWRGAGGLSGRRLLTMYLAACLLMPMVRLLPLGGPPVFAWAHARARLLDGLRDADGRHLVVVRYAPGHEPHDEWVYNEADIDSANVVWAREMDADRQKRLLAYFADRHVWLAEPDVDPLHLTPVRGPAGSGGAGGQGEVVERQGQHQVDGQ
jgi:hypothetical protein